MPMSPESDYCLNSLVQMLALTPDICMGVHRMKLDMDGLLDDMENETKSRRKQGKISPFCIEEFNHRAGGLITEKVLFWYENSASGYERAVMSCSGILETERQIDEAVSHVSGVIAEAHLLSRDITPAHMFPETQRVRELCSYSDIKGTDTLTSIRLVDAACNITPVSFWIELLREQSERISSGLRNISIPEFLVSFHEETQSNIHCLSELYEYSRQKNYSSAHVRNNSEKRELRRARHAAVRGIKLYERLFGNEGIRSFMAGGTMFIQGYLYNYHIRKTMNVVRHTMNPDGAHIPYCLDIVSKNGEKLASGCVYFKETPVIDQIIAVCLHVRERDSELTMLKTTNLFNKTPALRKERLLMELKKAPGSSDTMHDPEDYDVEALRLNMIFSDRTGYHNHRSALIDMISPHVRLHIAQASGLEEPRFRILSHPPETLELCFREFVRESEPQKIHFLS